ncbi:MAG TPA: hypothetical protein PLS31_05070 [Candidatus Sumerlaeota bacterium]|nr:hypothetical protein [Candidatus Sumerlaeota bacterium]HRR30332.1 hypothetical protein [Candidatus Sumerlaeia bacterium]
MGVALAAQLAGRLNLLGFYTAQPARATIHAQHYPASSHFSTPNEHIYFFIILKNQDTLT